jgi:hypothetical protein
MKRLLAVLVLPMLVWACVAAHKPALWKEPGVSFQGYRTVELMPVANDTGKSFSNFDVPAELTLILQKKLKDKGFTVDGAGQERVLVVNASLTEYEAGSALARWILPGAGATKCTLKVAVSDKQSGKPMSAFVESDSVAAGGLYTIGADRRILGTVAGKVADDLERLTRGE